MQLIFGGFAPENERNGEREERGDCANTGALARR
jgi:hypothetical protein